MSDDPKTEHLSRAQSGGDASPNTPLPHPASEHENYVYDDAPPNACAVRMRDNKPCGRDLYAAPSGIDKHPVCLMHSRDRKKDAAIFWKEINAILNDSSAYHRPEDYFDFSRFVFLAADFADQKFAKPANFSDATFALHTDFRNAKFTENAYFYGAEFFGATFSGDVYFGGAIFTQTVDFTRATFTQNAQFIGATCNKFANFEGATFTQEADFSRATFIQNVNFFAATFKRFANFSNVKFLQDANFKRTRFTQFACFTFATFVQDTDFSGATFTQNADFTFATFRKGLIVDNAAFGQRREKEQPPPTSSIPPSAPSIADFSNATFENPSLIRFFQVNKDSPQGLRARFLNCPIEQFDFTDVHWHKQWGRLVLQDEVDLRAGKREKVQLEPEYKLVAKLYRQLVNGFEKPRDYDLAEDCYVGAMEMQRLQPQGSLWTRSILLLYKGLSNYGSSVPRAFVWILFFLIIFFPTLYNFTGIRLVPGQSVTPTDVSKLKEHCRSALKDFAYTYAAATWLSLEVATFQKNTTIQAATMAGRHIALAETIIVPGQLALFFLALRRRFKR